MTDLRAIRRASSTQLLTRILEMPALAEQIQSLEAPVLAKLIERVGLEDAGELVAFATTEQLAEIFDEALWRSDRPGDEERFDAERFLVWLEIMLEAGDAFVAAKLVELPEDLVTLAFHRHVIVIRLDDLMAEMDPESDDAEAIDKALASSLGEELDEYHLVARGHEGWDSVLGALLALDRDHHDFLSRLLERCAHMSREHIDESGLYEVLTEGETLETDVAAEREARRAEAGHVAPTSAAAFLKLARGSTDASSERDPLTRAYFRELRRTSQARTPPPAPAGEKKSGRLAALLLASGIGERIEAAPLLGAGGAEREESLLAAAMRALAEEHPKELAERSEEIAYLANVLASGASLDGRRFRPAEAVRGALAMASLGLELATHGRRNDAAKTLASLTADTLFRIASSRLAAEIQAPGRAAAHPSLEPAEQEALDGLTDDCPHLAGALASEGNETPLFIGTLAQLDRAKRFLAELLVRAPVAKR